MACGVDGDDVAHPEPGGQGLLEMCLRPAASVWVEKPGPQVGEGRDQRRKAAMRNDPRDAVSHQCFPLRSTYGAALSMRKAVRALRMNSSGERMRASAFRM